MEDEIKTLLTLGAILVIGSVAYTIGRRTKLPRVTLLILFGVLIGPTALDILPELIGERRFPIITDIALLMIGFLLGEKLVLSFRKNVRTVLWISASVVVITSGLMLGGLLLIGAPIEVALVLAGIATATDPAATMDVVLEVKSKGNFTNTLLAIVAIDDAWGLIIFSFMLSIAQAIQTQGSGVEILLSSGWELGSACLVGFGLGIPMAFLTGRIQPGQPTLIEALGIVFLCGGIALWLEVSFILSAMVLGGVVASFARHHERPFHAIEDIELPFMVLFFVLAGASFYPVPLHQIGFIGGAFILLRVAGRIIGVWPGAAVNHSDPKFKKWMGITLLPQAGVALGMALVAVNRFPHIGEVVLPIVIGTTVLFELIGPVMTRIALNRVGEVPKNQ
jgi:Kef-type K+ transport system membrane component KefB